MGWVYLLRCADDSFYVGSTRDLEERLAQHSHAQIGYTSTRRPVVLEWCAEAEIPVAYEMERRIHGWSRRKKQALIDGDIDLLKQYSKRVRSDLRRNRMQGVTGTLRDGDGFAHHLLRDPTGRHPGP